MAILVKVPGSRHDKLLYLKIFFILNKNRHEEHKGFMCVTKSVKPPFLDRDTTDLSIPKANKLSILYQDAF